MLLAHDESRLLFAKALEDKLRSGAAFLGGVERGRKVSKIKNKCKSALKVCRQ